MKIEDKKLEDYYQKISYKITIASEIRVDVASVQEQGCICHKKRGILRELLEIKTMIAGT